MASHDSDDTDSNLRSFSALWYSKDSKRENATIQIVISNHERLIPDNI